VLSIAFAGRGQHQDAGAKAVHCASNTSSKIISKSISKDGGRAGYRGLVKVVRGAENCRSTVNCDALILDDHSRSDTYPYMEIEEKLVTIGHEATVSKIGDEQLLPRLQMGINAPLLGRLSFCLHLQPWSHDELAGYVQARLQEVGIHADPFEPSALQLLLQAGHGLPRLLNHLAQRALEEAALENSRAITSVHVQRALELMPWVAQIAP